MMQDLAMELQKYFLNKPIFANTTNPNYRAAKKQ